MKKLFCLLTVSFAALSAFGQGSVFFGNTEGRGPLVYGIDPANPTFRFLGGQREKLAGDGYSSQLFWGLTGTPEKSLEAVDSISSFGNGASAGLLLHGLGNSRLDIQGALGGT